jgi:uncharacterized Zn-finger protein
MSKCQICGRKFSRKDTLAIHVQGQENSTHTSKYNLPRLYCCKLCGVRYTMKNNLVRHLRISHDSPLNKITGAFRSSTLSNDQPRPNNSSHSGPGPSSEGQDKNMVVSLNPFELGGVSQDEDDDHPEGNEQKLSKKEPTNGTWP